MAEINASRRLTETQFNPNQRNVGSRIRLRIDGSHSSVATQSQGLHPGDRLPILYIMILYKRTVALLPRNWRNLRRRCSTSASPAVLRFQQLGWLSQGKHLSIFLPSGNLPLITHVRVQKRLMPSIYSTEIPTTSASTTKGKFYRRRCRIPAPGSPSSTPLSRWSNLPCWMLAVA